HPRTPLFPYTTLFRSDDPWNDVERKDLLGPLLVRIYGEGDPVVAEQLEREAMAALQLRGAEAVESVVQPPVAWSWLPDGRKHLRSEEHTSELQSRENL